MLTQPGGPARARQIYDTAKKKNAAAILVVEGELNQVGYELLQQNRTKDAIVVFQMNVDAYPTPRTPTTACRTRISPMAIPRKRCDTRSSR